jgi:hypothetical protein
MIEKVFTGNASTTRGSGKESPLIYAVLGGDFMICAISMIK